MAYNHHDGDFGIYMAHKISKLQSEQNDSNVIHTESSIFVGCTIYVNGYTNPPIEELRRLITMHGGMFNGYHISTTTHFICNHFTDAQVKQLSNRQTGSKVRLYYVTSLWILSSIAEGRRLPEANFVPDELRGQYGNLLSKYYQLSSKDSSESTKNAINDVVKPATSIPLLNQDTASLVKQVSTEASSHPISDKVAVIVTTNKTSAMMNNSEDNPEFLQQYFSRSRLHFIGTWRSRLPILVAELRGNASSNNAAINPFSLASKSLINNNNLRVSSNTLSTTASRVVLHVDMDCFFVSALVRDDPRLCSGTVPIAVAHSSNGGSSDISSCNYPARAKGLSSGMFMSEALSLCPDLTVLSYNFPLYEEISKEIYRILYSLSDCTVEAVSVDEAYLEFPASIDGEEKSSQIRRAIYDATRCHASAGISYNMLLARLATKKAKPNGQYVIATPATAKEYLRHMELEDLPGVGYSVKDKLSERGLITCGQLWEYPLDELKSIFGDALGQLLWNSCRGIDHTQLAPIQPRRSIGAEVNWGLRFTDINNADVFLTKLSGEVSKRLAEAGYKGKCITMKIKKRKADAAVTPAKFLGHGRVDNVSKSSTLSRDIYMSHDIAAVVVPLFRQLLQQHDVPVTDLRGMGIQVSKLTSTFDSKIKSKPISDTCTIQDDRISGNQDDNQDDGEEDPCDEHDGSDDDIEYEQTNVSSSHIADGAMNEDNMQSKQRYRALSPINNAEVIIIHDELLLTRSQEEFLSNIPFDMHDEVIRAYQQPINSIHVDDIISKSSTSHSSSPSTSYCLHQQAKDRSSSKRTNYASSAATEPSTSSSSSSSSSTSSLSSSSSHMKWNKDVKVKSKSKGKRQLDISTGFFMQSLQTDLKYSHTYHDTKRLLLDGLHEPPSKLSKKLPSTSSTSSAAAASTSSSGRWIESNDIHEHSYMDDDDIIAYRSFLYDDTNSYDSAASCSHDSIAYTSSAYISVIVDDPPIVAKNNNNIHHDDRDSILMRLEASIMHDDDIAMMRSISLWLKIKAHVIHINDHYHTPSYIHTDDGTSCMSCDSFHHAMDDICSSLQVVMYQLIEHKRFDRLLHVYRKFMKEMNDMHDGACIYDECSGRFHMKISGLVDAVDKRCMAMYHAHILSVS